MDEKKQKLLSRLSELTSFCRMERSKLKKTFDKIREEIGDKRGPEYISRTLEIVKDAKIHLRKEFEDLEQLSQTHNELLSHIGSIRSTKDDTLKSLTSFEGDLQDWLDFEFKEKGIDLTKEFQGLQEEIKHFQSLLDDKKTRIIEELEN